MISLFLCLVILSLPSSRPSSPRPVQSFHRYTTYCIKYHVYITSHAAVFTGWAVVRLWRCGVDHLVFLESHWCGDILLDKFGVMCGIFGPSCQKKTRIKYLTKALERGKSFLRYGNTVTDGVRHVLFDMGWIKLSYVLW